jgi:hypothetical protein
MTDMSGVLSGSYSTGITLTSNPTTITGSISAATGYAVFGPLGTAWTVDNQGHIVSTKAYGVALGDAGYVLNAAGASIIGNYGAVDMFRAGTVVNAGSLASTSPYGTAVLFYEGGDVINETGGVISTGIDIIGAGTVQNQGTIGGGIRLNTGAITNASGGVISGSYGIRVWNDATIVNAGTIASTVPGQLPAVFLGAEAGNELVIDPGAVFIGGVSEFLAGDTLDFANTVFTGVTFANGVLSLSSGGVTGATLSLTGNFVPGEFTLSSDGAGGTDVTLGVAQITASSGVAFELTAPASTIAAGVTISGKYTGVDGGYPRSWGLTNYGTILQTSTSFGYGADFGGIQQKTVLLTNAANALIDGHAGVRLSAGVLLNEGTIASSAGSTGTAIYIDNLYGSAAITLGVGSTLIGAIKGFQTGDTIDLAGTSVSAVSFANGVLTLENGGSAVGTLALTGNFNTAEFTLAPGGGGGTNILIGPSQTVSNSYTAGVRLSAAFTTITNAVSVSGGYGVYGSLGRNWTVVNAGTVTGPYAGVRMVSGDVTNGVGGIITSADAVDITEGSFINQGLVSGSSEGFVDYGVEGFTFSGQPLFVSNSSTGTISGVGGLAMEYAGATIADAGLIESSSGSVGTAISFTADNGRLIIDPGAVIIGSIAAVATMTGFSELLDQPVFNHVLEFAAGTGSFGGIGETVTGFNTIQLDAGASWSLSGNDTGFGSGTTISGFTSADTLDLASFATTSDTYVSGAGLVLYDGTASVTLDITGSFTTASFALHSDNAGGTVVEAPCFCAGTRLATARGNVPVERLRLGDLVKTARGLRPIRWIGTRGYDGRFIKGNRAALPVRIRRHALGHNVPSRDLWVSPDHAICEGGVLVHAWRLVNGVSITQAEAVERVDYFHIELDSHDIVFAHNTPVETFLDADCRNRFATAVGEPGEAVTPCRPRVEEGYYLARLKARIDARAGIVAAATAGPLRGCVDEAGARLRGWAQDVAAVETPVELDVLCDGRVVLRLLANRYREDLRRAGLGSGCHGFDVALPVPPGEVTIRRVPDGAVLAQLRAAA